jgi:serine/threonine protein kinase/tetratricopeptide (TPR) repeat protein
MADRDVTSNGSRSTPRPAGSSYVTAGPPSHDPRASQVIAEFSERWRNGERPRAEEYLARFPELLQHPEAAIDLIYEEICLRQDSDEVIDEEEVYRRFPQWRDQLKVLLRCDRILASAAPAPQFPAVGEKLGDYHLVGELGRGSQGRVFLAAQTNLADRPMVLKVTPPDGREHLSLARLQHTHIVPLYAVHDDGARNLRILCMPYLGGITLSRILDEVSQRTNEPKSGGRIVAALDAESKSRPGASFGRRPARTLLESLSYVQAVCWIGACLADGLEYAHERGLVHLDVKPSNVLIADDGQPMLLDFHLAHAPLSPNQPAPEWLGGTSAYMSPEQREVMTAVSQGRRIPRSVDRRSDIYSLGVVLYEALGGPRRGGKSSSPQLTNTERRDDFSLQTWTVGLDTAAPVVVPLSPDSWTRIELPSQPTANERPMAKAEARPPGFPPLHQCNPKVPLELSDLVHKCLAVEPTNRYESAAQVAADLRRHLTSQPLTGVATRSPRERWQKWRRRKPYVLAFIGMALLLLIAAIAVFLNSRAALRRQLAEARNALDRGRELRLAGHFNEAIPTLERGIQLAADLPWNDDVQRELDSQLQKAKGERTAVEYEKLTRELHRQADQIRFHASFDDLAPARMRAVEDACRAWWARRAEILSHAKPGAEPSKDLVDLALIAVDLRLRAADAANRTAAEQEAMTLLTEAYDVEASPVIPWMQQRISHPTSPVATPQARTQWELYSVGRFLLREGRAADAAPYLDEAVERQPAGLWPNFYRGVCAYRLNRFDEALSAFSACIALVPENPVCLYNRGLAYAALGRDERALQDYDAALQRDAAFAPASLNRGILHFRARRFPQAVADLERALRDGANANTVHYNLALVYRDQGDNARALENIEHVLKSDPNYPDAQALADTLRKQ